MRDLEDALNIIRRAQGETASGPDQPWRFLRNAERHLQRRLTEEFEPRWQELVGVA